MLLQNGANPNFKDERSGTPLLAAITEGKIETHLSNTIITNRYILFIIKYQGHDNIAKLLLNNGADVHFDFDGLVPLFLSAATGKLVIFSVKFIIYIK